MPLESGTEIQDLNPAWPLGVDQLSQGDNHIRLVKSCIQGSFPEMTDAWTTGAQITAGGFDATFNPIVNLPAPVADADAVNKKYVDDLNDAVSWGAIGETGSSGNTPGTGDWTAVRVSEGLYRITFDVPVPGNGLNYSFVATVFDQATPRVITHNNVSATQVDVRAWTVANTPQLDDCAFRFIRIIPTP